MRTGRGWRERLRLISIVAALLVPAGLFVPAGAAESPPRTRPSALWGAFPLRVEPPPAPVSPARSLFPPVRSAAPPVVVVRSPEPSGDGRLVAGGLVALLIAAAGAAFLVLRGPARRWDRAVTAAVSRSRAAAGLAGLLRAPRPVEPSYVLLLPGRSGWGDRLVERLGQAPSLGEVIYDDDLGRVGQAYVVKLVRRSPLPGDKRPCAVLRSL